MTRMGTTNGITNVLHLDPLLTQYFMTDSLSAGSCLYVNSIKKIIKIL